MKKWLFTASVDGVSIDFETIIKSDKEPDFWTCYKIAENHNCIFWTIEEI